MDLVEPASGSLAPREAEARLWARVAPCGGAVRGSRRLGPSSGQHTRPSAWRSTGISRLGLAEGPPPIAQGAGGLLVGWHRPESAGASEVQMREPRRWAGAPVAGARRVVEARCTSASPMKSPLVNGPRGGRERGSCTRRNRWSTSTRSRPRWPLVWSESLTRTRISPPPWEGTAMPDWYPAAEVDGAITTGVVVQELPPLVLTSKRNDSPSPASTMDAMTNRETWPAGALINQTWEP